ncbi:(d)CMP kinase [Pelagovum sp. HNIBRBA483]|uniref:(d)CMP kinase n=1 Tax=Pelagovum sp. HNIBRBA483 TaxID=3233341 RepID=UPI0034A5C08C
MSFTVAIDGPAAAGKGTISKAVAQRFGFAHLDTGLLYRAVGARVAEGEEPVAAAQSLNTKDLARQDLRTQAVADAASNVATNQQVREALVEFQRDFAAKEGGAVLDGRDIGTVICPDADVKLFVTARAEVRAKRRWEELCSAGGDADYDTVLAEVKARDTRDEGRKDAPMRRADDAVLLDTSDLTIEEAIARAVAAIEQARGQGAG